MQNSGGSINDRKQKLMKQVQDQEKWASKYAEGMNYCVDNNDDEKMATSRCANLMGTKIRTRVNGKILQGLLHGGTVKMKWIGY